MKEIWKKDFKKWFWKKKDASLLEDRYPWLEKVWMAAAKKYDTSYIIEQLGNRLKEAEEVINFVDNHNDTNQKVKEYLDNTWE